MPFYSEDLHIADEERVAYAFDTTQLDSFIPHRNSHEKNELINESHCSVFSEDDNTKLRIPVKLDRIFSLFPTRALTHKEIENCEDAQTMNLTPDAAQVDSYDKDFAEAEDRFLNFRGDFINHQVK